MPTKPTAILAIAAWLGCLSATARAADPASNPLNSSEKPDPKATAPKPEVPHDDLTVVPVVGGSSDVGVGGGFFAGLTRNQKDRLPFIWDVQTAGFISFGTREQHVVLPYLDLYAKVTVMRFLDAPMALEIRPSFTQEQALYYYGMGNASQAAPPVGRSWDYYQYTRTHPELRGDLRFKIRDHFVGRVGLRYIETWYDIPSNSKLAEDRATGSSEVKKLIGPTGTTGEALFRYGLQFDNRDNEVSPHSGTYDEIALNLGPGGTNDDLPYRYGEASANLRAYVPLFSPRVTLALRAVGDVLFGSVPFFELSRAVDTYAVGGSTGVRGVPAQRYYGKVKAFGNVELRARLFDFRALGKPFTMAGAAFFDAGRVWAETGPHPELDGSGVGLKYGVGGGLRLMAGTAFVLRGDVAWSPDARPVGAYLIAGEIF